METRKLVDRAKGKLMDHHDCGVGRVPLPPEDGDGHAQHAEAVAQDVIDGNLKP